MGPRKRPPFSYVSPQTLRCRCARWCAVVLAGAGSRDSAGATVLTFAASDGSRLHVDFAVLKTITLTTPADVGVVLGPDGTLLSGVGGQRWGVLPDLPPRAATSSAAGDTDAPATVDGDEKLNPDADLYELPDISKAVWAEPPHNPSGLGAQRSADYVSEALLRMVQPPTPNTITSLGFSSLLSDRVWISHPPYPLR